MRTNSWNMALIPLGLAAVMTPAFLLAAGGGGTGFDAVVHGIESRYHAHATRVPFMGLMSGIAGMATHGGVRGIHVAEFENFKGDGDQPVDGAEFNALIEKHMGEGWQRIIRETSREGGEQSLIYVRPEDNGKRLAMLVVDLDSHDLNVVQVSMNPDQLMAQVKQHQHNHHKDADSSDAGDSGESE